MHRIFESTRKSASSLVHLERPNKVVLLPWLKLIHITHSLERPFKCFWCNCSYQENKLLPMLTPDQQWSSASLVAKPQIITGHWQVVNALHCFHLWLLALNCFPNLPTNFNLPWAIENSKLKIKSLWPYQYAHIDQKL